MTAPTKSQAQAGKSKPKKSPAQKSAGKNRSNDQAGGPEHSGGDAKDDRNP